MQTMTNPRVFPRVKVLLAVLQLPTTIAKRKKGNFFPQWLKIYSWLKYDEDKNFMYCDACTKFNRKNSLHRNQECRNYQHTTLVTHASLNDHQTALQIPELQKNLRTIQKKSTSVKDKAALVLLKWVHWLCVENIPLSKFKILQTLLHDLGLQDIALLRETAIQYQSYFSALELAELPSDVVEEEVKRNWPSLQLLVH